MRLNNFTLFWPMKLLVRYAIFKQKLLGWLCGSVVIAIIWFSSCPSFPLLRKQHVLDTGISLAWIKRWRKQVEHIYTHHKVGSNKIADNLTKMIHNSIIYCERPPHMLSFPTLWILLFWSRIQETSFRCKCRHTTFTLLIWCHHMKLEFGMKQWFMEASCRKTDVSKFGTETLSSSEMVFGGMSCILPWV